MSPERLPALLFLPNHTQETRRLFNELEQWWAELQIDLEFVCHLGRCSTVFLCLTSAAATLPFGSGEIPQSATDKDVEVHVEEPQCTLHMLCVGEVGIL